MDRNKVIKGLECCLRGSDWEKMCDECPYEATEEEKQQVDWDCHLDQLRKDAIALLKEVEPVKHGRWEVWSRPGDEETGNCSVCKTTYSTEELFMGGTEFPKYCPECGARMDEEAE